MGLFHYWIPDSFGSMGNLFPNIFAAPLLTSTRENVWEKQSLGESRPRKPSPFMNVIPICPTNKTNKTGQGNTRMVKCGKLMQRPPCHNLLRLIIIIWGQRLKITKLECQKVIVSVDCQKGHIGHLRYLKVVCRLKNWYVSVDSLTHSPTKSPFGQFYNCRWTSVWQTFCPINSFCRRRRYFISNWFLLSCCVLYCPQMTKSRKLHGGEIYQEEVEKK